MSVEAIETTINLLCEKFGIVTESVCQLQPLVVKYFMCIYTIWTIIGIVLTVAAIIWGKKIYKLYKNDTILDYDMPLITAIVLGASGLILTIATGHNLFKWIMLPDMSFIEYLLTQVP